MKNNITREELKKIHDIACETWKTKIKDYGSNDPFSAEIKFTEKQINEMIQACDAKQLPVVKEIFDVRDSWEDINSFEDVIKYLGEEDEEVIQLRLLESLKISDKILAQQEAVCFVRALNDRFEFDWNDSTQRKWRIWWHMDTFRFDYSNYCDSHTVIPASLCFKNQTLSDYAGNNKNYKNICKRFMY